MKNVWLISFGVLFGAVWAAAQTSAPIKMKTQFSADMTMTVTEQNMTVASKINMDGEKMRVATEVQGIQMIMIMRKDLKKMYNVMPAQKMYMEMPIDDKVKQAEQAVYDPTAKWELVGTETIREQACDKYKITAKVGGQDTCVFFWVNKSNQNPVRVIPEDKKAVIDWDNFKEGAQPADLFEPPSDFQKMALPAGMGVPGGAAK